MFKHYGHLYGVGFLYVFGVGINTYIIAKELYLGIFITSFLLNWIWTSNIKRFSASNNADRLAYSLGAASGCISGVFLVKQFLILWTNH